MPLPLATSRTSAPLPGANLRFRQPATPSGDSSTPIGERFQSGESRPEWMDLGRQRWTLVSTNATSTTKVKRALEDPRVKAGLGKFSPTLQQQVGGLSDAQLKVLKGGMSGTTKVGPLTIDNRQAFIKGSVAMKSIWGNVHQTITDARTKYSMINPAEEKALHKLVDTVSPLKPEQRKQLAELMDLVR